MQGDWPPRAMSGPSVLWQRGLFMRTLLIAAALAFAALSAQAQLSTEECLACHDTVDAKKFSASTHAPLDCTGCHADITQVPHDPAPQKVDCGTCHADSVEAWNHSLHTKPGGARCTNCHGSPHEVQPLKRAQIP